MREIDFVSRWGGEEFVIALVDSSLEDSQKVAEKLRVIIENDSLLKSYVHHSISASFGLMQIQKGDIQEEILQRADKALYRAKDEGRNRVILG